MPQWTDEAILLGARSLGERKLILELMTKTHGRYLGCLQGGTSQRFRATLQPGNALRVTWRARLEEQLGLLTIEPLLLRAGGIIHDFEALNLLNTLVFYLHLLAEREPHASLYAQATYLLSDESVRSDAVRALIFFELEFLSRLGFGLDLRCCAKTGTRKDLAYVSPRTGRSVSRCVGEAYHDRLLLLPGFLRPDADEKKRVDNVDATAAFRLTAFFISGHLLQPRGLLFPFSRQALESRLCAVAS